MNAAHVPSPARDLTLSPLLLAVLIVLTGCKTQPSSRDMEASSHPAPKEAQPDQALSRDRVEQIITRVETWRDRPLSAPLEIKAHTGASLPRELLEEHIPDSVTLAANLWHSHLTGDQKPSSNHLDRALLPLDRLAHYDASTHTLHHVERAASPSELESAIAQAVTRALDLSLMPAQPRSPTLDQWLARRAVLDGDASLVSLSMALSHPGHEAENQSSPSAEQLAMRPELMLTRPESQLHLGPNLYGTAGMLDATQAFSHREGLAFMTALLRSHGWSGVEVALSLPPRSTAQILAPASWMKGQLAGDASVEVELPEAFTSRRAALGWGEDSAAQGQFGAAWLTMWLVNVATTATADGEAVAELDLQALQALPLSWRADRWQHHTLANDPSKSLLLWTSQWDAPTSASYVSRALQAALKHHAREDRSDAMRCEVAHQGLEVTLLCSNDQATSGEAAVLAHEVARDVRIRYTTAEPLPLTYKPSIIERLVQTSSRIELDEELTWSDPGLGVRGSLASLKAHHVQSTETGFVRWYAVSQGVTVQFFAEPLDVLTPSFESPAYGKKLSRKILDTMPGAKLIEGKPIRHTALGPVHEYRFKRPAAQGEQEGSVVHIWHMRHKDMTWTLSASAPISSSEHVVARTRSVFESLQPF